MHKKIFDKPLFGEEKYEFIFGDIDKTCLPQIVLDCRKLPFKDETFDCVILDPPYLQHKPTDRLSDKQLGRFMEYGFHNRAKTRNEFYYFIEQSLKESVRVLKRGGILIVKCQDEYRDKILYLHHVEIINRFPFDLHIIDFFIYRFHHANIALYQNRYSRGKRGTSLIVHSYYIVAKKIIETETTFDFDDIIFDFEE